MICSAPLPLEREAGGEEAELGAVAARLCGRPILGMERRTGGGNNRIYRVVVNGGSLALKAYGPPAANPLNDRLGREFAALSFLARHGRTDVPEAVAVDPSRRLGLYGWLDGAPPAREPAGRAPSDIDDMVRFVLAIQELRSVAGASAIGPAAEACPHGAELLRQIRTRLATLAGLQEEVELAAFLRGSLTPVLAEAEKRLHRIHQAEGLAVDVPLPSSLSILSPSDFGFHNALRRPDAHLAFLDFEYFGWDDPVKLLADTLWHPAYRLSPAEQVRWLEGGGGPLAAADPTLMVRLQASLPLYGLRWCVILLNEFLPERWYRRQHAGTATLWPQAKAAQLAKARAWLAEVRRLIDLPVSVLPIDAIPLHLPALSPAE